MNSVMRTVLVIGDKPDEIIARYNKDTVVPEYVRFKRDDAGEYRRKYLRLLDSILSSDQLNLSVRQRDAYKELYLDIHDMDEIEFYIYYTKKWASRYDEETGDCYSRINPEAHYERISNPQVILDKRHEESTFSTPFWMNDASKSYTARFNDICWERINAFPPVVEYYKRAWEVCVEDDEPKTDAEKRIKESMANRVKYFASFKNKEEYAIFSSSFFCYGVATDKSYHEISYKESEIEWVKGFYKRFLKKYEENGENPLLSIYEVRSIED